MSIIEIQTPYEVAETITVHTDEAPRDNAKEALRYYDEAEAPGLSEIEIQAKLDTAKYLSELALKDRVKEYSGEKTPTSR